MAPTACSQQLATQHDKLQAEVVEKHILLKRQTRGKNTERCTSKHSVKSCGCGVTKGLHQLNISKQGKSKQLQAKQWKPKKAKGLVDLQEGVHKLNWQCMACMPRRCDIHVSRT